MVCGLLRKSANSFLGNTRFYEEQYENYFQRPGAARYDRVRYVAMAEWMKAALGDFQPRAILDVGCGAGWSMTATAALYQGAAIEGVEPSLQNAKIAQRAGFTVHSTRLGSAQTLPRQYDLIYANNVLQHVVDPIGFVGDISAHLSFGGRVVFILPDAGEPSNEMLWCDHNFSFRAQDLATLAEKTNLHLINWQVNPRNNVLLNKQLVVLQKDKEPSDCATLIEQRYSAAELFDQRSQYLSSWRLLDSELMRRSRGHGRLFNFGASMWTWLLAGYCPEYWSGVQACLVDEEHGSCVGKPVVSPSEISFSGDDTIVLGVNPFNQAGFGQRLRGSGARVITWSDRVTA